MYLHILIYFSFRVNCSLLLEVMDTDKDGKVNEEEMTAWLRKTLRKNYKEDSGQIMSELDTDKDDKLSFEELLKTDEDIGGNCIALEVCNLIVSLFATQTLIFLIDAFFLTLLLNSHPKLHLKISLYVNRLYISLVI